MVRSAFSEVRVGHGADREISCGDHRLLKHELGYGHAVSGLCTGPGLHWHINSLKLLTALLALEEGQGQLFIGPV